MQERVTTKPFVSKRQQRFAFSTGQPWAKRWAKQTNFATLPEHKDAGTDAGAPLAGPGGLLSTPGLGTVRKRKGKKWGMRRKAVCTCGVTTKAPTGAPGESLGPGITRIRGNLCNVHGRYGPCDAGQATAKPKGKKGRGRKVGAKKPKVVHLTPEQKRAQRDAEHTQNQAKVLSSLGVDAAGQAALEALRSGQQPDPKAVERGGFEKAGLVEQAQDGSYRMTASGRAALTAAQAGDAGRAGSIISGARDRTSSRQARQTASATRQQAAATRRAQIAANRTAAKKPSGGRGKQVQSKNPAHVPPAPRATPNPKRAPARLSVPKGPSLSSPKPKPPAKAVAPKPFIAQPLKDAASALSTGADVTPTQIQQLVTNGLAKIGKDGRPILTAAGLTATKKAASNTPGDEMDAWMAEWTSLAAT